MLNLLVKALRLAAHTRPSQAVTGAARLDCLSFETGQIPGRSLVEERGLECFDMEKPGL
ncbi:predicted protein [Plenodomus lingam JN3]|uniref:Predicted protein n=1 Tax=Leptosphaeria maculans (strain JN3 / isolate v23.1.3 / race Av1-4-5-6-7-8) TaxID=985895 RepID=E4ZYA4_LEPMJ|nr:predicted protein [Plenodomus lingam JN3]CBX96349.1 predicted protein [Plenodomus lingam JN3]